MKVFPPIKLKRKDLEDVSDDFSDFTLSSPARKIRRLNAELPPIVEEEECDMPIAFDHIPDEKLRFGSSMPSGPNIEDLSRGPGIEERAIVLYNPRNTTAPTLLSSPSSYSISMSPQLLSGFKNHVLFPRRPNSPRRSNEEAEQNNNSGSYNECLALIPWTPSQPSFPPVEDSPCQGDSSDMMDAHEIEEEAMDVEDHTNFEQNTIAGGMPCSDGYHQWQQHCLMIPQPPQNTSATVVWYR